MERRGGSGGTRSSRLSNTIKPSCPSSSPRIASPFVMICRGKSIKSESGKIGGRGSRVSTIHGVFQHPARGDAQKFGRLAAGKGLLGGGEGRWRGATSTSPPCRFFDTLQVL